MTAAPEFHYNTLGEWALHYARHGFNVFPLAADKVPLTDNGMHDATTDPATIAGWWAQHPHALIGHRVDPNVVILDIDPRHGGLDTWQALVASYGEPPTTRQHHSGRNDGGFHIWWIKPDHKLSIRTLNEWARDNNVGHEVGAKHKRWVSGIDIISHAHRYTILPPSPHPATNEPYWWASKSKPAPMPNWLAHHLTEQAPAQPATTTPALRRVHDENSIADWFTAHHTWGDILYPAGWYIVDGDGDSDGSKWRHPNASARHSATIRHGVLFVYTDNTEFEPTEPENPKGYTRFRAWATLEHRGNMSEAARSARERRDGARRTQVAETAPTALGDAFWDARPYLSHIRQAARARRVSPFGVLGCTLAYVAAHTPPSTCLPPSVGTQAPLSLLIGLYGTSGAGKSTVAGVAGDLLRHLNDPHVVGPMGLGTGEGIAEAYHEWIDEKEDGKTKRVKRQTKRGAILLLDEGSMLKDLASRKGSIIMPALRIAWSGGDPGQANASAETRRNLRPHSYHFALISAWQDQAAQFLLADSDGGTPQRFLWFSSNDPDMPSERPEWPGTLDFQPPPFYELGMPFTVAPDVLDDIDRQRVEVVRGTIELDPLDAHRNLNKLKVAACLALLDGRARSITDDDWALAEHIMSSSDGIRDWIIQKARQAEQATLEASARRQATRETIVAETVAERALNGAAKSAWRAADRAAQAGGKASLRDISRSIAGKHRKLVTLSEAITKAIDNGWIEGDDDTGYTPGKSRPT